MGTTVALVVLAVVAVLGASLLQARTDLRSTTSALLWARVSLRVVTGEVASTTASLDGLRQQVATSQAALDQAESQLNSERGQLSQAEATLVAQGISITDLNTCLNGVQQAVNALAVGDQGSAVRALGSVSASCASVDASVS